MSKLPIYADGGKIVGWQETPDDWYNRVIEGPICPLVRLLRDNGINTKCSCGHEMYCECEYYGEDLTWLASLLWENGFKRFKIEVTVSSSLDGCCPHFRQFLTVWLPKPDGKFSKYSFHKGSGV